MNWKKEGYKIGEEMLLIAESLHNKSKPIIKKVKIISIDNSLLKVTDDAKEIMFYDSIVSHLCPINFTYILCKSEEDYKQYKKNCQERNSLICKIKNSIRNLSLNKLRKINKILLEREN